MNKKKVPLSKFFVKLHIKKEKSRKKDKTTYYMKTKTLLRPPAPILELLKWEDGDKIGIIIETNSPDEFRNPKSIRLVNVTKYPEKIFEVEALNINSNLRYSESQMIKNAIKDTLIQYKLKRRKSISKTIVKKAEEYLTGSQKPPEGMLWIYDEIAPLRFVPIFISQIREYYMDELGTWDYQTFSTEHYIPKEYKEACDILYTKKQKGGVRKYKAKKEGSGTKCK